METIKVLLVDDHTIVRQGIRALLESVPDIQIIGEAEDGKAAVEMAEKLRPNIMLVDISLPMLNGLEVTRRVRKKVPECKVLVLTMHENEMYVSQILRTGASGYLVKKTAVSELIMAIRSVHQGKAYFSPSISKIVLNDYLRKESRGEGPSTELLSNREREILQLLAEGYSNKEIAVILNLSVKTVSNHRNRIMQKLDIHDITSLVKYALKQGFIEI